jgi:hypothetical protein
MKFNFRKIANAAASAALIGSTVALAAAASFPQPFVSTGGTPDVAVVYGASASVDLGAVTDIEAALDLVADDTGGAVAGSGIPAGADWAKIEKSGNKLNLGDSVSSVLSTIDLDEFEGDYGAPDIDEDARILSDTFEFDAADDELYEQFFTTSSTMNVEFFEDEDLDEFDLYEGSRVPQVGFAFTSGDHILNYTLEFDDTASCGSTPGFDTCEGEPIMIMGREFWLLDFDNTTGTDHRIDFLDTSETHSISNDPPETIEINVDGTEISLEISTIDDDSDPEQVTFIANGDIQDEVEEGDTIELDATGIPADVYLGVKSISSSDGDGTVQFSIGSGKLTIKNGEEIELNGNDLGTVDIGSESNVYEDHLVNGYIGTSSNNWDSMTIEWLADSADLWLMPGMDLSLPGFDTVKFTMNMFETPDEELTKFDPVTDEQMELMVNVKDGEVTLPFLYTNSTDTDAIMGFGEDEDAELVTSNSTSLEVDLDTAQYFVASWRSGDDAESYIFEFDPDQVDEGDQAGQNDTRIVNMADSSDENTFDDSGDEKTYGELTLTLNHHNADTNVVNFSISASSSDYIGFDRIFTASGLTILLPFDCSGAGFSCALNHDINISAAPATYTVLMYEEDENDNIQSGENFNATVGFVGDSGSEKISITGTSETLLEENADSDDTIGYVVSELSTFLHMLDTDEEDSLEVTYFGTETQADVYLTEAGEGSGGGGSSSGVLRLTDADTIPTRNLIVVGGTCVNGVAAQLLGVTKPTCGTDWTAETDVGAGQYLIQSFSRSGKVATLVAGWEMADTANAATYLTQHDVITDPGQKYKGTTGSNAEVVVEA